MGKSKNRKRLDVFSTSIKDVKYKVNRAIKGGEYRGFIIESVRKSSIKDAMGLKKYWVTLRKKK